MTNAIDIATSFSGRLDRSRLYEMESVFLGVVSLPLLCGVAVGIASPRTLALNETLYQMASDVGFAKMLIGPRDARTMRSLPR